MPSRDQSGYVSAAHYQGPEYRKLAEGGVEGGAEQPKFTGDSAVQ